MNTETLPKTFGKTPGRAVCRLSCCCVMSLAAVMLTSPAQAGFHLWSIREVYTDASGTLQFIELATSFGGQVFVNGQTVSVVNVGGTQTHNFTIPGSSLSGNTANQALLFGTAGLQAAGGPAPDYIIPDNFLFPAGGTINFFGQGSGPYSALPTDGVNSRTWAGGNASNTPQNYAGSTGFVTAPEPAAFSVLGLGLGLWLRFRRKQT